MATLNFQIGKDLHKRLEDYAAAEELPKGWIIRRAIKEYLDQVAPEKPEGSPPPASPS